MHTNLKSTILILLIPAVFITSCSDPDDVVSNLLFENTPDIFDDLMFTLNRVNGWHHDNALIYGLDMEVRNTGNRTVDYIWLNVIDVTPASLTESHSTLGREIEMLQPNQTLKPQISWYFNLDSPNEVYIGNFYVYVRNTVASNLEFEVTFEVYIMVDGNEYETEIKRSFRTLSNHPVLSDFQCGEPITVNHTTADDFSPINQSITYGTLEVNGRCWTDRNLGATARASSALNLNPSVTGWYWQFNRKQGYYYNNNVRTPGTSWSSTSPATGNWSDSNNPCRALLGNAWGIPTSSDWHDVNNWSPDDYNGAFQSPLRLSVTGALGSNGQRANENLLLFWSMDTHDDDAFASVLYTTSDFSIINDIHKAYGVPIRCIM